MSAHDDLVRSWSEKLGTDAEYDCMLSENLRPGSYCVVYDVCWGDQDCDVASMFGPAYFDGPADFVAWVRGVELSRSLSYLCDAGDEDPQTPEAYLDSVDAESRPLVEAAIAAADAALAKPEVTAADAEAVITAFNELFGRDADAQFLAWGDVTCLFQPTEINEEFDAWSEDAGDLLDDDEPQMIVKRLIDDGEFDSGDPEQLEMVREMLSMFPMS